MIEQNRNSNARVQTLYDTYYRRTLIRTDRMFAKLFFLQWALGIIFAVWISPKTWMGTESSVHIHVYAAIFLGGLIAALPIYLILKQPGQTINRMVVAVAQIMFSILYIHLTGGRIETHFHIFGSLAFLAFYRDVRVLMTATMVTFADHLIRGYFWPESVYGVLMASPLRAFEHAGWVLFEDIFLLLSIREGIKSLWEIAEKQGDLKNALDQVQLNEDRLIHQNKGLERINLELDSFVYIASHDLRAPLRGISSFASFLEADYLDKLDQEGREHLHEIRKGVKRMAALIDDLLTLSRVSRIQNPYEVVKVNDLLVSVRDRIEFDLKALNVELIIESNLPEISADKIKLSELFVNLINNAIKFSSKNGRRPTVEVGGKELENSFQFFVKDNGIGIDAKYHHQIFQLFHRLHTDDEYEGTGAGLNIAKRIVEEHGGKIWVESRLGYGAIFFFEISKFLEEPNEVLLKESPICLEKLNSQKRLIKH